MTTQDVRPQEVEVGGVRFKVTPQRVYVRAEYIGSWVVLDPSSDPFGAIRRIAELEEERDRSADALLARVVQRIDNGLDLTVFGEEAGVTQIEALWRRDYGEGGISDLRPMLSGANFSEVLSAILQYEDEADARDAQEGE